MIVIDLSYGDFRTSGDFEELMDEYTAITERLMNRMKVIGFDKAHIYSEFRSKNLVSLAKVFPELEGDELNGR